MKKLGFGLMRLPLVDPRNPKSIDIDHFKKMVDVFMDRGFNYFDTAYTYHQSKSEAAFRQAVVERYPRDRYTITDKMPMWEVRQEADYERLFNVQLQRTGVDYFDYYWFHTLNKGYVDVLDRTNGWDFILRKQKEGRIRNIGFSFHDDSPTLERILKEHP
ncbi:MAG: aldo/keto reductase, partial [Bacteroidales bacterium]|nr:aldo/keto reductase [Bacteroidales bacterium]